MNRNRIPHVLKSQKSIMQKDSTGLFRLLSMLHHRERYNQRNYNNHIPSDTQYCGAEDRVEPATSGQVTRKSFFGRTHTVLRNGYSAKQSWRGY
jgi:hypothetical protein